MIQADIYIEHVTDPAPNLFFAVIPAFHEETIVEKAMWAFFANGFQLARERITEQCADRFKTSIGINVPTGTTDEVKAKLRAQGRLNCPGATMSISEGLCLWIYSPFGASKDTFEVGGLATIKQAYEVVSDFWTTGKRGKIEEDFERVMAQVRSALAKLPVFPQ